MLQAAEKSRKDWHTRRANAAMQADGICVAYASGLSVAQVADRFGVSVGTVRNILRRAGQPTRSRSEGNALRWTEPDFRANQVEQKRGKPASNKGCTWTIGRPIVRPNQRGDKNHFWRGGRLSLQLLIRRSGPYKFWRRSVFERDDHTCVGCGARGVRLEADHVYPFAKILDDFGITTVDEALVCAALWATDNGRTLCKPCHRETETFGVKKKRKA